MQNENQPNTETTEQPADTQRRKFLRRAAYSTPTLLALGALMGSQDASADCDPSGSEPPPFDC